MTHHCILEDDLVFYALGELDGPRRRHLEEHLTLCPECRKRTGQYQQVRRHLRKTSGQADAAIYRTLLTQRILADARSEPTIPTSSARRRSWRWQPALVAVIVIVLGGMLLTATDVAGRFPFSKYVGLESTVERQPFSEDELRDLEPPWKSYREVLQSRDTNAPVPEGRQTPDELPLGLYLDESFVMENGDVVHYYLSRDYGLEVAVGLEDRATSQTQLMGQNAIVRTLRGVDVLVDRRPSNHVNSLLWINGDTLITLRITRAYGGYEVTSDELLPVAEAIMQDRTDNKTREERE